MSTEIAAQNESSKIPGPSLRQAALVAGIGLLIVSITAPFSQFYVFPSLSVPESAALTVQNLADNRGLFLVGIISYLLNYTFDIVVAWALYVLLAPVNRALSQLTFVFCLIYIAMALTALLNYIDAFRLLGSPEAKEALGSQFLEAQIYVLFNSYQYDWGFSLIIFGFVLLLRGYLVVLTDYIPSIQGYLLIVAGVGYIVYVLGLYVVPDANLGFLTVTFAAEPIFMIWLILKGRLIPENSNW